MKNLSNHVDTILNESLDGFAAAHAEIVTLGADREFVRRKNTKPGKVALISGGGSGHEPLHAGFVGHGMLEPALDKFSPRLLPIKCSTQRRR
jgi:phosphoenolpyruvate---glycerone phosphotransferase subunit DhaK